LLGGLVLHCIGIDAHKDTLAAAAVDQQGRQVDARTFTNTPDGYVELIDWVCQHEASRIGIEGSGSLGRQAAPQLTAQGRRRGRNHSKTDPIDALIIARVVLRDQDLPAVLCTNGGWGIESCSQNSKEWCFSAAGPMWPCGSD